jgi:diaminopimelate decarboxylase
MFEKRWVCLESPKTGLTEDSDRGRVIAGDAGIPVSRVLYTKQSGEKRFLNRDAAMDDPIRRETVEDLIRHERLDS